MLYSPVTNGEKIALSSSTDEPWCPKTPTDKQGQQIKTTHNTIPGMKYYHLILSFGIHVMELNKDYNQPFHFLRNNNKYGNHIVAPSRWQLRYLCSNITNSIKLMFGTYLCMMPQKEMISSKGVSNAFVDKQFLMKPEK